MANSSSAHASRERIAILGAGNIGSAIARGLVSANLYQPAEITLTTRSPASLEQFKSKGFVVATDNGVAVKNARIIIIAVTPQQLDGLLQTIKGSVDSQRHLIVSVVSG
ncbi:MAG: NAD(P)-binding domain-containing protein, partial [Bacteroidota bacterium]